MNTNNISQKLLAQLELLGIEDKDISDKLIIFEVTEFKQANKPTK